MLKYLSCIVVLMACQSTPNAKVLKTDCDKFRKGIFFYRGDEDKVLYRIERHDSFQREYVGKTKNYFDFKIKWISDCSYELSFLRQHTDGVDTKAGSNPSIVKVDFVNIQNDSGFVVTTNGLIKQRGILYIDRK